MVKTEPDVKLKVITKSNIEPNKEHKQDVKPNIKFDTESNQDVKRPDTNKIIYEEEKVALILVTTAVFTVWWMFKCLQPLVKNSHLGQDITWHISSSLGINL